MRKYFTGPLALFSSIFQNRSLILVLTKREIIGRYRGSLIGGVWAFIHPFFMLLIYTFVFGVIFKAKWGAAEESKSEFALVLFSGVLVYSLFAECINRSPGLILSHVNFVKKIVFPLEILPVVALLNSMFHMVISFLVWIVFYVVLFSWPKWTVLFFPVVLLPLVLFTLGLSLALASLGVFLRDIGQVVGLVTTALLFLSPVFYPGKSLPEQYQHILYLNPLTSVIEASRDVLVWGNIPSISLLAFQSVVALLVLWGGFAWFQKTRKGFADVL